MLRSFARAGIFATSQPRLAPAQTNIKISPTLRDAMKIPVTGPGGAAASDMTDWTVCMIGEIPTPSLPSNWITSSFPERRQSVERGLTSVINLDAVHV